MKAAAVILAAALGASALFAGTASAADLGVAVAPPPPPAAAPITNSIGIEVSPEFFATPPADNHVTNSLADSYIKGIYSHTFPGGITWGASIQYTARVSNSSYQWQPETTLGYTFKITPTVALPVSAGLGYVANSDPTYSPHRDFAYYVFNVALNVKLNSHWTWNAISARYRNAFGGNWETPKVSTGVTYSIDPHNAVYLNVGFGWQTDTHYGDATKPNKWNLALGYKYGF